MFGFRVLRSVGLEGLLPFWVQGLLSLEFLGVLGGAMKLPGLL